jgi:hypothetical protein
MQTLTSTGSAKLLSKIILVGSLVNDATRFLSAERAPLALIIWGAANKTPAKAELSRRIGQNIGYNWLEKVEGNEVAPQE